MSLYDVASNDCSPLREGDGDVGPGQARRAAGRRQGLTLVHFSAQLKRFLWDRGCIQALFRGGAGGIRGYCGVCRVYFVSETV